MRIYFFIFFLQTFLLVKGQNSIYPFKNYTSDDGLPSNECHRILQDKKGYIWIATDRGLCRYDGYTFKRYGRSQGLTDVAVMNMQLDKDENIWMTTVSKNVFIYNANTDSIVPYKYGHLFEKYKKYSNSLIDFYVDQDLNLYLNFWGFPMIKIDSTGTLVMDYEKVSTNYVKAIEIENRLLLNFVSIDSNFIPKSFYKKMKNGSKITSVGYLDINNEKITDIRYNNKSLLNGFALSIIENDAALLSFFEASYLFKNNKLIKYNFETTRSIISTPLGYIGLNATRQDASLYCSLEDIVDNKPISKIMEGIDPASVLLDRDGDLWITTLNHGIFKINLHNVKLIESTKSKKITSLVHDNKKNLIFIQDKKSIKRIDLSQNKIEILVQNQPELNMLLFDNIENNLVIATQESYILDNAAKHYLKHTYKHLGSVTTSIKYAYQDDLNYLIAINISNIMIYKSKASIYQAPPVYIHPKKVRLNAAISYPDSNLILGTNDGLYQFKHNGFEKFEVCTDLLNIRINDIKKYGPIYYLATMGNGLVVWDGLDHFYQITARDGLVSDNIERLHIDKKGNIYTCTYNGLSILRQKSNKNYLIDNYSTNNGLPSNEVNEVTTIGDQIYAATSKGIAVISGLRPVAKSHKPLIVTTTINGNALTLQSKSLSHTENNINIEFHTIDYSLEGKIIYRYKINDQEWQTTSSTQLSLVDLPSGKYHIEIQSMNNDSKWSESTPINFIIRKPYWQTWYFRLAVLGLFILIIFRIFKLYIQRLKEKTIIQDKINNLQRSALQAQMNPHFIFNCLNSIQNYIMRNDKDMAMEYLTKFARLIRQYLNASNTDLVTLEDDISMLDNYLKLEQMRFNHNFIYIFEVNPDIDITSVKIPPMLIQPFVENAVLHGMSFITSGGIINLKFDQTPELLHIMIKDNGSGFKTTTPNKQRSSLGVYITQKRLQYINDNTERNYNITTKSDDNGTEINIFIKIT